MNSYAEVDGVPAAADRILLTDTLRGQWGFAGVVVSDYFAVAFLHTLHRVAGSDGEAAGRALWAGIDVELPSVATFGAPLIEALRAGQVQEALVDRALRRVLQQKIEIGLVEPDFDPAIVGEPELDTPKSRALALELAREAIVLLENDGVLPLKPGLRLAVVGPLADDPLAMLGCYSFPAHVGVRHPETGLGITIPTVLDELRRRHDGPVSHQRGSDVKALGQEGFAAATAEASAADVAVVVLGDQAGLFGRGTSGEGCDAADLRLPGEQQALLEAVLATGIPVVLLLLAGRPYALGDFAERCAAIVQAFFPGQLGGQAVAEVLTGAVNPSGHLPVGIPRHRSAQPTTYLAPPLGLQNEVSNIDPTPLYPFGHGLSYGQLTWQRTGAANEEWRIGGETSVSITLANETDRRIDDVVQVYLHDPIAQTTRPDMKLVAYQRVVLEAGAVATVVFRLHSDLTSFVGLGGLRIVEPGEVELRVARSAGDIHAVARRVLIGTEQASGADRELVARSEVVYARSSSAEERA